jgi:hypothetical protein
MTTWPKSWLAAVESCHKHILTTALYPKSSEEHFAKILDALSLVGALKDPPKPREYLRCPKCAMTYEVGSVMAVEGIPGQFIRHPVTKKEMCEAPPIEQWMKVREVMDEILGQKE